MDTVVTVTRAQRRAARLIIDRAERGLGDKVTPWVRAVAAAPYADSFVDTGETDDADGAARHPVRVVVAR